MITGRAGCRYTPFDGSSHFCDLGRLAGGARVTVDVVVTANGPLTRDVDFYPRHEKDFVSYPDLDDSDNHAQVVVRAG